MNQKKTTKKRANGKEMELEMESGNGDPIS